MELEWATPEQYGKLWGVKPRQVQALCADGKISGAMRLGRVWLIPKDTPKPADGRTKVAREAKTLNRLAKTNAQQR
jgi:hypothetical protein